MAFEDVAKPCVLSGSLSEADGEAVGVEPGGGTTQTLVGQDDVAEAHGTGTSYDFGYASMIGNEVFDAEVISCVPAREVRDDCEAFGLWWPIAFARERPDGPPRRGRR